LKIKEEPFNLTVKKIDDYLARKNLSQTINELKDLKAIVNFLKENNIDEFNEDTKVYTYNNSNK
jgi:spore coat polysaccharide biosynthesis protein SpsF (cytidylyltransferase family)